MVVVVVARLIAAVSDVPSEAVADDSVGVENGMVVVIVVDMRRVTVWPADIEGLGAGSGMVVGWSCAAPAIGSIVLTGIGLDAEEIFGDSDPGIGMIVVEVAAWIELSNVVVG